MTQRLTKLQSAWKTVQRRQKALEQSMAAGTNPFEEVRLAEDYRKAVQVFCDLLASIQGKTPVKIARPPLSHALVKK